MRKAPGCRASPELSPECHFYPCAWVALSRNSRADPTGHPFCLRGRLGAHAGSSSQRRYKTAPVGTYLGQIVDIGIAHTVPSFVHASALLEGAYAFAISAHHGPRREGETDIDHPLAVAELLHDAGYPESIVAAALLHDVVEDTATSIEEIADLYGSEVSFLVQEMTEDESLEPYEHRKAEHRSRIIRTGEVAAIYAADKLATLRTLDVQDEDSPGPKLEHYRRTLEVLCKERPDLPFLVELRRRLDVIAERPEDDGDGVDGDETEPADPGGPASEARAFGRRPPQSSRPRQGGSDSR